MNNKIHNLTDNEIQKLQDAASIVKKMAKYVEQVNTTNKLLEKNLDEAIKAGDVTNEQKIKMARYESAQQNYNELMNKIKENCPESCDCSNEKHDTCSIYQDFIIALWMNDVCKGIDFGWEWIFKYACLGRKMWKFKDSYELQKLLKN